MMLGVQRERTVGVGAGGGDGADRKKRKPERGPGEGSLQPGGAKRTKRLGGEAPSQGAGCGSWRALPPALPVPGLKLPAPRGTLYVCACSDPPSPPHTLWLGAARCMQMLLHPTLRGDWCGSLRWTPWPALHAAEGRRQRCCPAWRPRPATAAATTCRWSSCRASLSSAVRLPRQRWRPGQPRLAPLAAAPQRGRPSPRPLAAARGAHPPQCLRCPAPARHPCACTRNW